MTSSSSSEDDECRRTVTTETVSVRSSKQPDEDKSQATPADTWNAQRGAAIRQLQARWRDQAAATATSSTPARMSPVRTPAQRVATMPRRMEPPRRTSPKAKTPPPKKRTPTPRRATPPVRKATPPPKKRSSPPVRSVPPQVRRSPPPSKGKTPRQRTPPQERTPPRRAIVAYDSSAESSDNDEAQAAVIQSRAEQGNRRNQTPRGGACTGPQPCSSQLTAPLPPVPVTENGMFGVPYADMHGVPPRTLGLYAENIRSRSSAYGEDVKKYSRVKTLLDDYDKASSKMRKAKKELNDAMNRYYEALLKLDKYAQASEEAKYLYDRACVREATIRYGRNWDNERGYPKQLLKERKRDEEQADRAREQKRQEEEERKKERKKRKDSESDSDTQYKKKK